MSFIQYDPQIQSGGALVANAIKNVLKAKEDLALAWNIVYQVTYSGGPSALEGSSEFDVASGKGADFYTALDQVRSAVSFVPDDAIAKLYQGSNNF